MRNPAFKRVGMGRVVQLRAVMHGCDDSAHSPTRPSAAAEPKAQVEKAPTPEIPGLFSCSRSAEGVSEATARDLP